VRLLALTSSYPKFPGDVTAPFIESISRALVARGHALDIILPEHPDLRRPEEAGLRFLPYGYAPSPRWALWGYAQSLKADVRVRGAAFALAPLVASAVRRAVSDALTTRRYDAALLHWVVPNAVLVVDILRAHRLPWVVSLHGSDVFVAERLAPLRALAGDALGGAGAVTACSSDLLERARHLGARRERSRRVPYGVDAAAFSGESAAGATRRRLGVPDGAVLVLAVGRLVEKKGFRYLVEAAAHARGVHVVIAGGGDLREDLERMAVSRGAPVALVGPLDRETVAAAMAAADIVAVPSVVDRAGNVDGLPNVLLEALGAGRAIVASRVAGIPDVVEDGVNGCLVPPGEPLALAEVLTRLAQDPGERERLGRAAREHAARELTWAAHAAALEECLVQATTLAAR